MGNMLAVLGLSSDSCTSSSSICAGYTGRLFLLFRTEERLTMYEVTAKINAPACNESEAMQKIAHTP
jgi:hypothetical protein